jgi:hypothetical protein
VHFNDPSPIVRGLMGSGFSGYLSAQPRLLEKTGTFPRVCRLKMPNPGFLKMQVEALFGSKKIVNLKKSKRRL